MRLDNHELYELLRDKGIENLFHANSIATSITYIEQGGLLSRQDIETKELYQTPQSSDDIDKLFGIYGDVFLDTKDLHQHFRRQNYYGPVLFKFSLDLILDDELEIWITKDNPIYWNRRGKIRKNYFKSVKKLSKKWDKYEPHRMMLTIRKPDKPILFDHLEEIVLDNPNVRVRKSISLRKESRKALKRATKNDPNLRAMLTWRVCGNCFCKDNYLNQVRVPDLLQKFLPIDHASFEK